MATSDTLLIPKNEDVERKIKEIKNKYISSLKKLGIDGEDADLLIVIAELADEVTRLEELCMNIQKDLIEMQSKFN